MSLIANQDISFEEAIAFTQKLIAEMANMTEEEKELAVKSLVNSMNGARGFFVSYLTDDDPIADENSEGIVKGLASSPEIVGDLLVKNIAMSTAMKVYHLRNDDPKMADSSARVTMRSKKLVDLLNLDAIRQKLIKLQNTLINNEGEYQSFLERFGYDAEQKQEILKVIS